MNACTSFTRADLFSPELWHSSPPAILTDRHTSLSHSLGARSVIGTRTRFSAVRTFPILHHEVN